jgi:hypothetical protein
MISEPRQPGGEPGASGAWFRLELEVTVAETRAASADATNRSASRSLRAPIASTPRSAIRCAELVAEAAIGEAR